MDDDTEDDRSCEEKGGVCSVSVNGLCVECGFPVFVDELDQA